MKNVSSIKSNKVDSPKTPGGISKSLLTPCRRLGLSRNWKKAGPSPFVSPLAGNTPKPEPKVEEKEPRKRKQREIDEENNPEAEENNMTLTNSKIDVDVNKSDLDVNKSEEIVGTPSRRLTLPRKKKSKLLSAITNVKENVITCHPRKDINCVEEVKQETEHTSIDSKCDDEANSNKIEAIESAKDNDFKVTEVATPVRSLSRSKSRKSNKFDELRVQKQAIIDVTAKDITETPTHIEDTPSNDKNELQCKTKSPNELTKECIVVIQKKIFKTDKIGVSCNNKIETEKTEDKKLNKQESKSSKIKTPLIIAEKDDKKTTTTFDSDSDDVALSNLKDKKTIADKAKHDTDDFDDEFEENKIKISKLKNKTTSITGLKTKLKPVKVKPKLTTPIELSSQSSFDDDEDFEFQTKKTILIRKCYNKVCKPLKARSTGSITQQDIDELRSRIEAKKKLLLAKAVCTDTEELRGLIKKWQRGCQDALMELMELMKHKFQDKQNMDYADMLRSLKIPATLVGYDEENDCFTTPDDATIVLSKFNFVR